MSEVPESWWTAYSRFKSQEREQLFWRIAMFLWHHRPVAEYYMEFGSHRALTFRLAWDILGQPFNLNFVAADSFRGLPEVRDLDKNELLSAGDLRTDRSEFESTLIDHGIDMSRVHIIEGFFDDTLTARQRESLPGKAAVIYVDCDLYHSTVPVLNFALHYLARGTILVFDDWHLYFSDPNFGEQRAFNEFRARHRNVGFQPLWETGEAKAFVCTTPPDDSRHV